MKDKEIIIKKIYQAFKNNEYPGDDFLLGSKEGREPFEEIEAFKGQLDWRRVDPELLDTHSGALNFFSEAGLRFFLPAYLIADLNGELRYADPLFALTHGFSDISIEHKVGSQVFIRKTGRTAFVNPLRYGAMTFFDYARYRLSIFSREEAEAIVQYLRYKQKNDLLEIEYSQIESALVSFWLARAKNAPTSEQIREYLCEERDYIEALNSISEDSG
ncbi:MAG: hypothetical protein ACWGN2_08385 [Anaerolineales bacterium]